MPRLDRNSQVRPVLGFGTDNVLAQGDVEIDVLIATVVAHLRSRFLVIEEHVEAHRHPDVAGSYDIDQSFVSDSWLRKGVVRELGLHLVCGR